jgi:hypothetical protein
MDDDRAAQLARIERRLNNLGDVVLACVAFAMAWAAGYWLMHFATFWNVIGIPVAVFVVTFFLLRRAYRQNPRIA